MLESSRSPLAETLAPQSAVAVPPPLYTDDVERVWAEYGHRIRNISRSRSIVYAVPPPAVSPGGIILPASLTGFFANLPNLAPLVRALVLAPGSESELAAGEWVLFSRLYFTWFLRLPSDRFIGTVEEQYVAGVVDRPERPFPLADAP